MHLQKVKSKHQPIRKRKNYILKHSISIYHTQLIPNLPWGSGCCCCPKGWKYFFLPPPFWELTFWVFFDPKKFLILRVSSMYPALIKQLKNINRDSRSQFLEFNKTQTHWKSHHHQYSVFLFVCQSLTVSICLSVFVFVFLSIWSILCLDLNYIHCLIVSKSFCHKVKAKTNQKRA